MTDEEIAAAARPARADTGPRFVHVGRHANDDARGRSGSEDAAEVLTPVKCALYHGFLIPEIRDVGQYRERHTVHVLQSYSRDDLEQRIVTLALVHHCVVEGVALHDELQVVEMRHTAGLLGELLTVPQEGSHVPFELVRSYAVLLHSLHLRHGGRQGLPPVAGLRDYRERRHTAALPARIRVVHLSSSERRRVPLGVERVQ